MSALRIEKHLNVLKLNELKKKGVANKDKPSVPSVSKEQKDEIITIDSDDD